MIKAILIFAFLIPYCCTHNVFAQEENVWVVGSYGGLDFSSGAPVPFKSSIDAFEACASVCDANGRLLFYTEGDTVWNSNHQNMPNGDGLTGVPLCRTCNGRYSSTASSQNGALIVPMPDDDKKFYIFSLTSAEYGFLQGRLYYSVVDMSLNGGIGGVVSGQKGILLDSNFTESMTGIVGDNCNVWLIAHPRSENKFKSFEITANGINTTPVVSNVPFSAFSGVMSSAPDRRKFVMCNTQLQLFDFDPATGIVSNPVNLDDASTISVWDAHFSPDGSKLYASGYFGNIYQYDLSLNNLSAIINSRKAIARTTSLACFKKGPDNKLYFKYTDSSFTPEEMETNIAAIAFPDVPGQACQFVPKAVQLLPGTSINYGGRQLPHVVPIVKPEYTGSKQYEMADCYATEYTIVAAAGGHDYIWDGGTTSSTLTVDSTGMYIVHYLTPPCIHHDDTFNVSFPPGVPTIGSFEGCKNEANSFLWITPESGDETMYTYNWMNEQGQVLRTSSLTGPDTFFVSNTGKYLLYLRGSNGCDTVLSITLTVPSYQASFNADTNVCQGEAVQFNNTSSSDLSNWSWYFGDNSNSSDQHPVHTFDRSGTYTIRLTANSSYPCYDTTYQILNVDSAYAVSFTRDKDQICEGEEVRFYPVFPRTMTGFRWNFGDNTTDTSNAQSLHSFDTNGTVLVSLTASFKACPDTSFISPITVHPYPSVNIGMDTSICLNGDAIYLFSNTVNPPGFKYYWNNGDTSQTIRVGHYGLYTLTIISTEGCNNTDSVNISKSCYLDIPNAFTPDGDGTNDYFIPRQQLGKQIKLFSMMVLDRWGQVIFRSDKDGGRGWDGKYNGIPQPSGTYIYIIETNVGNNRAEKYQGNVTLIR